MLEILRRDMRAPISRQPIAGSAPALSYPGNSETRQNNSLVGPRACVKGAQGVPRDSLNNNSFRVNAASNKDSLAHAPRESIANRALVTSPISADDRQR